MRASIEHELALIAQLQYAPYFLTVHDIVRYARSQGILCQGRGSAANSAVCFCLGITEVDPDRADLLFERFISPERREPPDIDVDFEHERREEVIQYIYGKYGRERAGIAATVICYRGRSAIREVGKAFGLSEDTIGALSSSIWGGGGGAVSQDAVARSRARSRQPARARRSRRWPREIVGFPRHLSQHVGGFVITRSRLDEVMPIGNARHAGPHLHRMGQGRSRRAGHSEDRRARPRHADVPAQGARSGGAALRRKADARHHPRRGPAVYRMLGRADSLGVFQVESRAQMTMLPRLQAGEFLRPGDRGGDRAPRPDPGRHGASLSAPPAADWSRSSYPSKELEAVLAKTLGVPLFQEQAMKIAIVAAGFTPAEADKLRRAMATFKRVGTIGTFQRKMIDGMLANGYERDFAERCFHQIEGFGEYGFPESHAASFALLVYASAWLKCHYPDAFAAALLNAQPMGFYAPAQIVRDAREHGVEVRPPDVNHSQWDSTLEPARAPPIACTNCIATCATTCARRMRMRLGLREIKGLSEEDAKLIVENGAALLTTPCAMSGCAPAYRRACWSGWPMPMPSVRSA